MNRPGEPGFWDTFVASPLSDGRTWFLWLHLRFYTRAGLLIEVPARFETDFASVPRLFTNIIPSWGRYGPAAVIHDWLYWTRLVDRPAADLILLEAMECLDVRPRTRWVIYHAVSWFGKHAWNEDGELRQREGLTRMRPFGATWPGPPSWRRRGTKGATRHDWKVHDRRNVP
jgi:Protein of unknown function (DUF1353)